MDAHLEEEKISKNYNSAAAIFYQAEAFGKAAQRLTDSANDLLKRSGCRLGLAADPFRLPINTHRQLQSLNENAFSDCLAWVFEFACEQIDRPLLFFETILRQDAHPESGLQQHSQEVPTIRREVSVPHGHDGQTGRLDLLVDFKRAKRTWHIEVKRYGAEQADLGKNPGYVRWLDSCFTNCEHILLVTRAGEITYERFRPLTWKELTLRIRSWVANSPQQRLAEAMLLFFCALVEQKLLDITKGSLRQIAYIEKSMEEFNASGR